MTASKLRIHKVRVGRGSEISVMVKPASVRAKLEREARHRRVRVAIAFGKNIR